MNVRGEERAVIGRVHVPLRLTETRGECLALA